MNTFRILLTLIVIAALSSCSEEEMHIDDGDYILFGHFHGLCFGEECIETFKLTDAKLFEDLNDHYAIDGPFNFIELGNDKFVAVNDIITFFPAELYDEANISIGCPDCADQGGITIQRFKDGELRKWRIDNNKSAVPAYLHDFMDKVNEKIALIGN